MRAGTPRRATCFRRCDGRDATTRDLERVAEAVSHRSSAFFHARLDLHPRAPVPTRPAGVTGSGGTRT